MDVDSANFKNFQTHAWLPMTQPSQESSFVNPTMWETNEALSIARSSGQHVDLQDVPPLEADLKPTSEMMLDCVVLDNESMWDGSDVESSGSEASNDTQSWEMVVMEDTNGQPMVKEVSGNTFHLAASLPPTTPQFSKTNIDLDNMNAGGDTQQKMVWLCT